MHCHYFGFVPLCCPCEQLLSNPSDIIACHTDTGVAMTLCNTSSDLRVVIYDLKILAGFLFNILLITAQCFSHTSQKQTFRLILLVVGGLWPMWVSLFDSIYLINVVLLPDLWSPAKMTLIRIYKTNWNSKKAWRNKIWWSAAVRYEIDLLFKIKFSENTKSFRYDHNNKIIGHLFKFKFSVNVLHG